MGFDITGLFYFYALVFLIKSILDSRLLPFLDLWMTRFDKNDRFQISQDLDEQHVVNGCMCMCADSYI